MVMGQGQRHWNATVAARRLVGALGVLGIVFGAAVPTARAASARSMYADTLAWEQTVRSAMQASDAVPEVVGDVRAVVAAYEALVRRYPGSGYSDNALWQGGRLALDAYARFNQASDRQTGMRLFKKLARTYPTSKFARDAAGQIARLESAPAAVSTSSEESASDGASSRTRLATIKSIRRSVLPDAVRITIEVDGEVPFREERIADPMRVFVDLPGTRPAPALVDRTLRFEADADVVRQVRIGRHPNNTTRVVLDAAGVISYSVYPLYSPYRLVIDCVRSSPTVKVVASAPGLLLPARATATALLRRVPAVQPRATRLLAEAREAALAPPPVVKIAELKVVRPVSPPIAPTPPPVVRQSAPDSTTSVPARKTAEAGAAAPPKNLGGGFSIARQLGLGVSRIVIDAGHGGHDPGARGKGVTESELVLDVALRLEKLLQKAPGVEVILTRRTDEFIPLPERTAIANREGADLFLSIHANASPNATARGIETYFLNFANNLSAAAVAARENATSGQAMGALPDLVRSIALNNKLDESRDFASQVQRAMYERLKATNKTIRDLGVKQAPFVVLIGASMPSVLAEISFVTNPQEARLLKGNAYRQKIAESLFEAIRKYQGSLKSASAVALQ
jgi:N-acetylmuramoyl-L-alanine amidase